MFDNITVEQLLKDNEDVPSCEIEEELPPNNTYIPTL